MGRTRRGDALTAIRPASPVECVVSTSQRADLGSTKRTRMPLGLRAEVGTGGRWYSGTDASGCSVISAELAAAITSDPGAYYVNLHNAGFQAGAIRGQLKEPRWVSSRYGS